MTEYEYQQGMKDLCIRNAIAQKRIKNYVLADVFSNAAKGFYLRLELLSRQEAAEKVDAVKEMRYLEFTRHVIHEEDYADFVERDNAEELKREEQKAKKAENE